MNLKYKADWSKSQERFTAFWEQEIVDRAVVLAMAPKEKSFPPGWCRILDEEAQSNIETVAVKMEQLFDNLYFAGDAYPMWYPNLGPGVLTAFTGSRIFYDVNKSTSWQEHSVLALEDYHPQLQTDGLWAKTLEINKFISRLAAGKFIAGICDLGTGADLISNVIGPEALCMEIMDNPEQIKRILKEFFEIWKTCYSALYKEFPEGNGSCCWLQTWAPGTSYPLQNDFSCMVSEQTFRELFLEDLKSYCDWLEYPVYHLDGANATRHLSALLEIKNLRAIQWTAGAGAAALPAWIPMLRRIQEAGKGVFIYVHPHELDIVIEGLRPEGIVLHVFADSAEIANRAVAKVARWSK